jgi:hypothetical protein
MCDVSAIPGLADLRAQTDGHGDICVAVLDSPVDHDHPAFDGANFHRLAGPWPPADFDGPAAAHGTIVSSVIFGQSDGPVFGVAPGCRGISVPVFSGRHPRTSQLDLARGIERAVAAGAHVINVSCGQLSPSGEAEDILARAIEYCRDNNVLVVAAAGNEGCFCTHVPAALPSVLAVGALDDDGRPMETSNWGAAYQRQGILAPGSNILGAVPGGATDTRSGTSLAAPIVAGVAALLLSLELRHGREPDPLAVGAALLRSADPCEYDDVAVCARYLTGKLNIERAVQAVSTETTGATGIVEQSCACGGTEADAPGCACASPSEIAADPPPARVPEPAPAVPAPQLVAASSMPVPAVTLSDDTSDASDAAKQLVYAIGSIGYDFGSEARRDAFKQQMPPVRVQGPPVVTPPEVKLTLRTAHIRNVTVVNRNNRQHITAGEIDTAILEYTVPGNLDPVRVPVMDGTISAGVLDGGDLEGHTLYNGTLSAVTVLGIRQMITVAANPYDPVQMLDHLVHRPSEARALIWTMNLELTPIYALNPFGPYGADVYEQFVWILAGQMVAQGFEKQVVRILNESPVYRAKLEQSIRSGEGVPNYERFALPGQQNDQTSKLFSGQVVPGVDVAETRGVVGWNINQLIEEACREAVVRENLRREAENKRLAKAQQLAPLSELPPTAEDQLNQQIRDFLNKLYYELRNLGQMSQDRAMNFGATNAFQAVRILVNAQVKELALDTVSAQKSPYMRVDSDSWDILLRFFNPYNLNVARTVYRFSVDVSDVMPVLVGEVRQWTET